MSKTSLSSPRRRGSQSPNGEKNYHADETIHTASIPQININSCTDVPVARLQAIDLTPDPSPKERGAKHENSVSPLIHSNTLVPNNTLVPKLPLGNALSCEASASLSETEFREHVVSQTGPPLADWDTDNINSLKTASAVLEMGSKSVNSGVLNIGLFGFGCVGQGLYDVLNHSQGLKASIGKICVKDKSKPRSIDMDHFTFSKHEVLESTEHNLIVELTSDADAALEIITDSLAKGRSVVTAGKKVLAENFELLYLLQQQTGASLLYEAACAGSIPIIRTLEEYYDNELLSSVRGILNGSSNYILSKMEFDKLSYADALTQAQRAGFAESDPTLDVNGTDAKYKLCLLAVHAFGVILKPAEVFNLGIQNITAFDITCAAKNNLRIKLIAGIHKTSAGFRAYVLPKFVPAGEPLAGINYEYNGIEVEGVYSDKQLFTGKGAGSHPTGSAVLSDISAITYNYKYGYKKLKKFRNQIPLLRGVATPKALTGCVSFGEEPIDVTRDNRLPETGFTLRLYIRYDDKQSLRGLDIRRIEEEYTSTTTGSSYVVAEVGFESLSKLNSECNGLFVCEV